MKKKIGKHKYYTPNETLTNLSLSDNQPGERFLGSSHSKNCGQISYLLIDNSVSENNCIMWAWNTVQTQLSVFVVVSLSLTLEQHRNEHVLSP